MMGPHSKIKVIVLLAFCEKYDSPFVIDVIFPDSDTNEETNDFLNNLIYNNNNNNNNNDDINDINENIFEITDNIVDAQSHTYDHKKAAKDYVYRLKLLGIQKHQIVGSMGDTANFNGAVAKFMNVPQY